MKMTVGTMNLNFDSSKSIAELKLCMPENTSMLAVQLKDENVLNINFMASTEMFESDLWREYHFFICKCNYSTIDIVNHQFIGTVNVGNDVFAVFYEKGLIV